MMDLDLSDLLCLEPPTFGRKSTSAAPVSILDLSFGMCAEVIDGDFPLPHYCGAPVTNYRYRLCAQHAQGFFTSKPPLAPRTKQGLPINPQTMEPL